MSKERLEKSERTPPVSSRPWALAYSPDRPYNSSCLSAVSKKRRFGSFSRLRSVIWRGKAFREQQCQFLTRNKSLSSENESNCSMTFECVRTDSILPEAPASSTLDVNSRFSRFQFSAFFIVFVYARAKIRCYRFFLISTCEKSYAASKPTG